MTKDTTFVASFGLDLFRVASKPPFLQNKNKKGLQMLLDFMSVWQRLSVVKMKPKQKEGEKSWKK